MRQRLPCEECTGSHSTPSRLMLREAAVQSGRMKAASSRRRSVSNARADVLIHGQINHQPSSRHRGRHFISPFYRRSYSAKFNPPSCAPSPCMLPRSNRSSSVRPRSAAPPSLPAGMRWSRLVRSSLVRAIPPSHGILGCIDSETWKCHWQSL